MAVSEGDFKSEFKRDLVGVYPNALVWTNTDLVRAGLPDFSVYHARLFAPIEAKFITALPKRKGSHVLKHEVSASQCTYLKAAQKNGAWGIVLIGTPDVAIYFEEIKNNYTLEECVRAPRIEKVAGKWQVKGFLDGRL
jgi:hypothetical protein